LNEHEKAECYLQSIVTSSQRAEVGSAETHRQSAISNIKNALCHGEYGEEETRRLKRMIASLEGASRDSPERKFESVQTVIAVLTSMGMVENP
jgi:hypothetical protein